MLARVAARYNSSVPAASAAAGALTAVRVKTPAQHEREGNVVTHMWNRFNIEPTNAFDIGEARQAATTTMVTDMTRGRKVTIYRTTPSAMTSGLHASKWWSLRFAHTDKWTNPLMGWISGTDTMSALLHYTRFESPEQAIMLCERNGWDWEVDIAASYVPVRGKVVNEYSSNFLPVEVLTKMKALGPRRARHIFEGNLRKDLFVNYRRTDFGPDVWEPADYQTQAAWTGEAWPAAKPAQH